MPRPKRKAATVEGAIADMRKKISSRAISPGTRIPEEDLAQAYDLPRAKAREVLATLEDRSLITREPNKGAIVAAVDMETTYRLYEVREALDGLAVRLATLNSKTSDWDDISELFGPSFEESLKAGDIDRHVEAIETFRARITEAAQNPVLTDLIERIYDRTRVTIRRVALLPGRAQMGILQYRAVLSAMIRGDADEAELRIRELNRSAREYIERYKDYVL
ncbi:GntR family transcriptional regulator [Bosea lathyri]|jgi:DNA-binding GntR family transcriptional regulator|uniref:Transcriptional regulator, GntR family n=1 Tax=Bosea lathyri TaxID=1036778 RepID=A0A1H5YU81_9HYPH|nr:GntR family transcriptional regulator [Bosea lathyri]SEG27380.1 transcriptional regulator, GntR family [Bosea lathyri]